MKKKTLFLSLALTGLSIGLLASCGKKKVSDNNNNTTTNGVDTTTDSNIPTSGFITSSNTTTTIIDDAEYVTSSYAFDGGFISINMLGNEINSIMTFNSMDYSVYKPIYYNEKIIGFKVFIFQKAFQIILKLLQKKISHYLNLY